MSHYSKIKVDSFVRIPIKEVRDIERAKGLLTAIDKYNGSKILLYDSGSQEWFGVPMCHFKISDLSLLADEVIDNRALGFSLEMMFTSEYWPGQAEVLRRFEQGVKAGRTGFVLKAPCGFGKTTCLIKMLEVLGRTALVVVPRSSLVKQWISRLLEHSDLKKRDIGVVLSGKAVWKGKKVVVGLVHSLALDRYGADFKRAFGTIVFDEVDRSVPPATFAPVVVMFPAKYRIGASATTKRQDGMEVVFEKHVGQMILKGADENRAKPKVYMHEFTGDSGFVYLGSKKLNRRGMLLSKLSKNIARNLLIARYIKALHKSDRRVLVLSDRTAQLRELRLLCFKKHNIPLVDMGYCVRSLDLGGGKKKQISAKERSRVANDCKIIFGTYGLMALGVDIPDLAGLVYATPQSQIEQSKGRIERIVVGKKTPVVIDICDSFYPDAVNWARNRERQYRAESLKIIKRRG